jgi:hypothetical protein
MVTSGVALALVLVLRTYDMVGLPRHEIATAQRVASTVLGRARVDVSWLSCQRAGVPSHDSPCDEAHLPSELILRILDASAHPTNAALADANVDIDAAFGSFATLYVDRIRNLAAASGVDFGTLMGRAIAHEVGHLLLGTSSHAATGLMRAVWSSPMLRHDGDWAWTFSGTEADGLRRKLRERIALAASVQSDLIETLPPIRPCPKLPGLACAGPSAELRSSAAESVAVAK